MSESWVLKDSVSAADLAELPAHQERLRRLYLEEYSAAYDELIRDVRLLPFSTPAEAARLLTIISRPDGFSSDAVARSRPAPDDVFRSCRTEERRRQECQVSVGTWPLRPLNENPPRILSEDPVALAVLPCTRTSSRSGSRVSTVKLRAAL